MIQYAFAIVFQVLLWLCKGLFWLVVGIFYWIFTGGTVKKVLLRLFAVFAVCLSVWGGIELNNRYESKKKEQQFMESIEGTTEYICIAKEFINIRVSPSTTASVLGRVNRGSTVYVYEIKDGFARVRYGSKIGYANAKFIKIKQQQ